MHTQHGEHNLILPFFEKFDPAHLFFLDIGANDGITFSNTWDLSTLGWSGCCIEPSRIAFSLLQDNYKNKKEIHLFNFGISDSIGEKKFFESGNWLGRFDTPPAVLSSLEEEHMNNFFGMQWNETQAKFTTFENFLFQSPLKKFDFISIDVEGHDYVVLQQINLDEVECKLICLEHSQNQKLLDQHSLYCQRFGFTELGRTLDNILFHKI